MKFPGWFGIIVGFSMLAQWSFSLATGQVPELQTEPFRIYFHLASEFVTAMGLLVSGIGLLMNKSWGKVGYPVATGMLLYSPGIFCATRTVGTGRDVCRSAHPCTGQHWIRAAFQACLTNKPSISSTAAPTAPDPAPQAESTLLPLRTPNA